MGGQRHAPVALQPGKRPDTDRRGRWVGPRAVVTVAKNFALTGIRSPQTAQPVASRYTD